ncbi:GntR family transcriptional regulator [Citrobacter rodentium]|jgi:Transcriptional regulators|uniref:GntR-family transcriptional regulator n=2 Tax=Citrobacter rodentium TaxID=67825 RepID=D2TSM9_CITRI|nr:GntR family transcriptional regulator [Citrobacter rodentium]KIQ53004.1 GntR family transcriptional regulator [Citrobacter rodentium]QBY30057.1 GntR family transcriptional regulator [Citrobacter rodentium]UHO32560.1 GntR family transcriptional regulator [Citrobacter rodentium NBRC 105723 = DSM 16636]CBG90420.1 putative GntR-family transcriptional regulator [Citrobacter rodentium ICC168]HAT8014405.1 GntR family transcriptional regulator [Citrobacter rodentium NBRC 105723 = DSM 16636]
MPKYMDIYHKVRHRIVAGVYAPDKKLPEGTRLAAEFACSELTVAKALDLLVREGLVLRKRGLGSFVKRQVSAASNSHLIGTAQRCASYGKTLSTRIEQYAAVPANQDIAQKLQIPEGELVHEIQRVRIIDDLPSIIEYTWMPVALFPHLNLSHIQHSIYAYLTHELGHTIHSAHMTVTGLNASEQERQWLKLSEPTILIQVEQTAFLDNGRLFEYSRARHLWHTFNFETDYVRV